MRLVVVVRSIYKSEEECESRSEGSLMREGEVARDS